MQLTDITVVILTRNEAATIAAALQALPAACPRIVYDAESTDSTQALAAANGATVIVRPWTNFRDARTAALRCSRTAWTFMLDADEQPDADLLAAIAAADPGPEIAGYQMQRRNYFCGRAIVGGAWARESVLRLVRTERASITGKDGGTVHEQIVVSGSVDRLAGRIEHYSYPSLAVYWLKFARYTAIEAADIRAAGGRFPVRRLLRALPSALWQFAGKGGWRDGWRGAFIAAASAAYPFAVAAKVLRPCR